MIAHVLYSIDHGAQENGKPVTALKGWFIDSRGRRHEERRCVERYADEKTIEVARRKIADQLHRGTK